MKYSRVWTDEAGESHLADLTPTFIDTENYAIGVPVVGLSPPLNAGVVHFVKFPAGWVGDWHPTPTRQKYILVEGQMGGATSDGSELVLQPGDCGLLEDTSGKGHRSWTVGDKDAVMIMVTLPD
jgi:hypothetical protein